MDYQYSWKRIKVVCRNDHNIEFHRSVRVIGPDGTIYKSITDCGIKTKHDRHTIARWIKENPEKGFKYEWGSYSKNLVFNDYMWKLHINM